MARRDLLGAVDFGALETYAGHDAGVVEEVLALFVEQSRAWMRLMDPAGPGFRDAAHTLKGAALGLSAGELAQACDRAEAGAAAPVAERGVLADRVRDALDRALHDIAAYRHERLLQGLRTG